MNSPAPSFQLRPLTIADFEQVTSLWRRTDGLSQLESAEELDRFLERNPNCSIVAEDDGTLLGAILCGHDGRRGYMYHAAVTVLARGRGVGRAMVEHCLAHLKSLAIQRVTLFTLDDHCPAKEFWKHLGFRHRDDIAQFAYDLKQFD
ncbi:MAG: GNAT family N-acetyltransferase [Planctomycetaceae bacterium]|jgi:ribosomal protein S18 acetylase RimI-like enzyme|nr:GNAT family N-acetyltransferase [Planctomycetaceae bacterium]MBK97050.1 GNAT family N-acetyltransferase [Planctomycetaceae bacterium]|tara:strand:+ start:2628 stop:3068 length:441 start_codon:yes stop_codon:yes gene_type:complete